MTKHAERVFHTMEMRLLRWSLGLARMDRVQNTDVMETLGIAPIQDKIMEAKLRWYGHKQKMEEDSVSN